MDRAVTEMSWAMVNLLFVGHFWISRTANPIDKMGHALEPSRRATSGTKDARACDGAGFGKSEPDAYGATNPIGS